MKKILLFASILMFSVTFVNAEELRSRVYVGANISQSFVDFAYNEFITGFTEENSSSKLLYGPRYDFVAGFRLTPKLKVEGQYLIISQNSFNTDKANSEVVYKASAVFANLIFDFWNMDTSFITPFIGIGAGVGSSNLVLNYNAIKKDADENGFSWQIQGGASVKLLDWLYVNAKYTYLSLPGVDRTLTIDPSNPDSEYIKSEFKKGVQAVGVGVTFLL